MSHNYTPFSVWPAPPSGEGGGVTVHSQLTGRSAANAHPVSAITGLQAALDAGARVWSVGSLIANGTIEDLITLITWAGVPEAGYVYDDDGLKYVEPDTETITLVTDHQPGDIALVVSNLNLATFAPDPGGFQTFTAANTLSPSGPWLAIQDDFIAVNATDWTGTLSSLPDDPTLEAVLDALGALDLTQPDLSGYVEFADLAGYVEFADLAGYVASNDSRLSDARTPTAHAASHREGGSDVLHAPRFRIAQPSAPFDIDVGETVNFDFTMAPLYALTYVQTVEPDLRIRVYTDSARRTADVARSFATPPGFDSGVILDVELDSATKLDITPAVIGFTAGAGFDSHPNGSTVYVAVTNIGASDVTDTIGFLILYVDLHDGLDGTPLGGDPFNATS